MTGPSLTYHLADGRWAGDSTLRAGAARHHALQHLPQPRLLHAHTHALARCTPGGRTSRYNDNGCVHLRWGRPGATERTTELADAPAFLPSLTSTPQVDEGGRWGRRTKRVATRRTSARLFSINTQHRAPHTFAQHFLPACKHLLPAIP